MSERTETLDGPPKRKANMGYFASLKWLIENIDMKWIDKRDRNDGVHPPDAVTFCSEIFRKDIDVVISDLWYIYEDSRNTGETKK